jgi:pyruvate dehydrogenase E1 component
MARRQILNGPVPTRVVRRVPPVLPDPKVFADLLAGSGSQQVSTTMAFARLLRNLVRDADAGAYFAPIVADEARTFGLESIIAESKIYAPEGQRYTPVDADLPLRYAESTSGQLLQEGITEAGAMSSFMALATSYATWARPMVPVYLFYSMFGFQRIGDLAWALGDMRGRGILAGCTAGRTTLQGEGLQHDDGQSPLLASTNPAVRIYDPAFSYELAIVVEEAVTKTLGADPEDRFFYITLYNENYPMPPLPEGTRGEEIKRGVLRGLYRFEDRDEQPDRRATICFSGPMWQIAQEARRLLAEHYGVGCDTWSATSWATLRQDAIEVERWNRLHPHDEHRRPFVTTELGSGSTPVVAVTDYMRAVPDQVSRWVERPFVSLGTDGFGRSDARPALRHYFEVDAGHVVVAVLTELARGGEVTADEVQDAIGRFGIDADAMAPFRF